MGNGFPFHLFEQGGHSDGDISKHEEREGKGVKDFLSSGTIDIFPFSDGGKQAKGIDKQVKIHEQRANGLDGNRDHLGDRIQAEQSQEQKAHVDDDA